jgi:ATP-dependent DNA ligase
MKNPDAPAVRGKAEEAWAYLLLPKTPNCNEFLDCLEVRTRSIRAGPVHPPQVDYKPRPALTGIHEIKHDGFRLTARRDPVGIRPITRRGNDWTTATR